MDSTQLRVPGLKLRTTASRLDADVAFDFCSFSANKGGHCRALLDAEIGYDDIANLSVGYVDKNICVCCPIVPLV